MAVMVIVSTDVLSVLSAFKQYMVGIMEALKDIIEKIDGITCYMGIGVQNLNRGVVPC